MACANTQAQRSILCYHLTGLNKRLSFVLVSLLHGVMNASYFCLSHISSYSIHVIFTIRQNINVINFLKNALGGRVIVQQPSLGKIFPFCLSHLSRWLSLLYGDAECVAA